MVRTNYFTNVPFNRVVPQFLTQFGITDSEEHRVQFGTPIPDDPPKHIQWHPGMVSFAGNGPNSRTTEVFIVMPDAPEHQLRAFGQNPWETPFAEVADHGSFDMLLDLISYGDIMPFGNGPDVHRIYTEGQQYLKREFPDMDYIADCRIPREHHSHHEHSTEDLPGWNAEKAVFDEEL